MKILLLEHPRTFLPERCNDIANTPLSSCLLTGYTAAVLRSKGHEVKIVEGHLDGLSYREMEKTVSDTGPELLGVHIVYHWESHKELFRSLKAMKEGGACQHIIAYGFYPTFASGEILSECSALDAVVIGEPEQTLGELAEALSQKKSLRAIAGLACRDGTGGIDLRLRKFQSDLDGIPFPVRTEAMFRLPEVNIQGSRGCYGACTFCHIGPFYGGSSWRGRSPENIAAEIDELINQRGARDFYFTDPNFFGPGERGQQRALQLALLLKPKKIRFGIEARVNDIHEKTIKALTEAGLHQILIGLESGRDQALRRMNKMTSVTDNERAVRLLRRYGLEPNVGFIMFEPDSTLEDVRVNFQFLKRNDLINRLTVTANVLYHHQIVLKGTPAYRRLLEEGRLEVSPAFPYEGRTFPADGRAAVLARIMRGITNRIFLSLAGIWGGWEKEPDDAPQKYALLNNLLVDWFETLLTALEAGETFTDDQAARYLAEAERAVASVLER
ncbi:MAG: B12-binding domain-containing radical SAM protein [Firmicutes bacterium]|nr:B12-binding domain-containing radical SAM protein [Bacillota bacterium]